MRSGAMKKAYSQNCLPLKAKHLPPALDAGAGLTARFQRPSRENGVGEISRDAAFDDTPIQILEFKTVSTSCSVAKR
jgi:hypothetical protein